jgi:SAM-dependent methyltransferase
MSPQVGAHRRSAARTAVVWDALQGALGDTEAAVVDIGGGTGGFAVRVAELGHRVTVVDPSPDALAALGRRATESGVADRVTGHQGDLANLLELVGEHSADVVLCHGVLGIVQAPVRAAVQAYGDSLAAIATVLRPGGTLSLLVGQRHAAVVARAMAGHFVAARALLDDPIAAGDTIHRFSVEEVTAALTDAGFEVTAVHGVRVFADLVPSALVDAEAGAAEALVELERAVTDRPEYLPLATQLHVLATRP